MHIAVAGNIGSGKTTLTNMLSKHYGWETHFEDVDHNPYLNDFYHDMQRWSFNLQIYYLNSRFTQIQDIKKTEGWSFIFCTHFRMSNPGDYAQQEYQPWKILIQWVRRPLSSLSAVFTARVLYAIGEIQPHLLP